MTDIKKHIKSIQDFLSWIKKSPDEQEKLRELPFNTCLSGTIFSAVCCPALFSSIFPVLFLTYLVFQPLTQHDGSNSSENDTDLMPLWLLLGTIASCLVLSTIVSTIYACFKNGADVDGILDRYIKNDLESGTPLLTADGKGDISSYASINEIFDQNLNTPSENNDTHDSPDMLEAEAEHKLVAQTEPKKTGELDQVNPNSEDKKMCKASARNMRP